MSKIDEDFGKRVKFYRIYKGFSQEKLAELSELHPTHLGRIERGQKICTLKTAERIAKALKVPIEDLLENTDHFPQKEFEEFLKLSAQDKRTIFKIMRKNVKIKHE